MASVPVAVAMPKPDSRKGDARAALMMMPGLSPSARAVGLQIVDHFNLRTGQCNPSIARIAGLCGLSARSVQRGVSALVAAGLIARVRNGGRGHANDYAPVWERLGGAPSGLDEAAGGAVSRAAAERVTLLAAKGDRIGCQTESGNITTPVEEKARRRRTKLTDPRQPALMLPIAGGRAATPREKPMLVPNLLRRRQRFDDVAAQKATERLFAAYDRQARGNGERLVCRLDPSRNADWFEAWDKGVAAERRRAGTGWAVFQAAALGQDNQRFEAGKASSS